MKKTNDEKNENLKNELENEQNLVDELNAEIEVDNVDKVSKVNEPKKIVPWVLIASIGLIGAIVAVVAYTLNYGVSGGPVAKYDGGKVTQAEYEELWQVVKAQYGIDDEILANEEYAEDIKSIRQDLIYNLAYEEIIFLKLEELGLNELNEEVSAEAEEYAQEGLDSVVSANLETLKAELAQEVGEDYTEEQLEAKVDAYETEIMQEYGYKDYADYLDAVKESFIIEEAVKVLLPEEEIAPTEEEIQAIYDEAVATEQAGYESNIDNFIQYYDETTPTLVVPEGLRYVRHVLITLDEEISTEISTLEQAEDMDAAEALYNEEFAKLEAKAEEVLGLINSGEITFDEAIETYGGDPGMTYYPQGYMVAAGSALYVQSFTDGAMSLENVGDITGLVPSDYGYHIIEYYSDVEASVTPIEDVYDEYYAGLLSNKQADEWYLLIDEWADELNLVFQDESMNESQEEATTESEVTE